MNDRIEHGQRDATGRAARSRRTPARIAGIALIAGLLGGCGGSGATTPRTPTGPTTPVTPLALGSTQGEATGRTVDAIQCQTEEQVLFHIHAHLAVFINGVPATVPEGIGIAPPRTVDTTGPGPFVTGGSCFYWLHGHTADGVIHIESPDNRGYTLGNYFDLWSQPLGRTRVAGANGPVTAFLNGRPFSGDPRLIPLAAHGVIQLDVGTKVAPASYHFANGL